MAEYKTRTQDEVYYTNKLTKLWHESPMYHEALRNAKVGVNQYRCAVCQKIFKLREVQVDHIIPKVDPITGWERTDVFAARLNCPASGLQVLCEDFCHMAKTRDENKLRHKGS